MRINAIKTDAADVTLDVNELVALANIMYFYEKYGAIYPDFSKPNPAFHDLAKQIITARDICQYGRMDSHSLTLAVTHELQARPDGHLNAALKKLLETGETGETSGAES